MTNDTPILSPFDTTKARLQRILRRCGWTIHLQKRRGRCVVHAAKRDPEGQWHGVHIAPFHRIDDMDTGEIVAILPPVA